MKFKVGDKARVVKSGSSGFDVGEVISIIEVLSPFSNGTQRLRANNSISSYIVYNDNLQPFTSLPINITFANKYEHQAVQQFLFDNGCKWCCGGETRPLDFHNNAMMVTERKELSNYMSTKIDEDYKHLPTYTIADLDTIKEILNHKNPISTIQLNSEHTAEINKDTKTVKVGCQTFTFDKVNELARVINENSKQIGG